MLVWMALLRWTLQLCTQRLWERLKHRCAIIKLSFWSLVYNDFVDKYYVGDTCMEPMFWFVDNFTKVLGPIFVVVVFLMFLSIVAIAYIIGLPYWWEHSVTVTIVTLVLGHWLLVNITFHYYMAFVTQPGYPPEGALIPEAVSICKKCIAPKPPRAHHCSICNRCILKMDHHCPWLNNCIGHFNHRYFFMFCAYTWLGVIFVMVFGYRLAYEHLFGSDDIQVSQSGREETTPSDQDPYVKKAAEEKLSGTGVAPGNATVSKSDVAHSLYHACIIYAGLVSIGVCLALGALMAWHSQLITRGETCIEAHINKKETVRLQKEGKVYKNPYNFGSRQNWIIFLGLTNGRSWTNLLFPSAHGPSGNGLQWHTVFQHNRSPQDNSTFAVCD